MCGIFGVTIGANQRFDKKNLEEMIGNLFVLSETRGKEAAGIAINNGTALYVAKDAISASAFIKSKPYRRLLDDSLAGFANGGTRPAISVIGHSRLVTNGAQGINENNQPVVRDGIVGIHNGIVVNDSELWTKYQDIKRHADVDTEVILALCRKFLATGMDPASALKKTFSELDGAASIAFLLDDRDQLLLGTNNGSLYYCIEPVEQIFLFTSERFILDSFLSKDQFKNMKNRPEVLQLAPNTGLIVDIKSLAVQKVEFERPDQMGHAFPAGLPKNILDTSHRVAEARDKMRRCSRCILPETFPFLDFDAQGVCTICRNYLSIKPLGLDALNQRINKFRRTDGRPDCMVSISGGRDSSFGLHVIKKELGMNPIAYTYDWGLVTDLARRNISRLCGRLGVEHILVSADIKKKRDNVRRNISAWLKRPRLGVIPLFMAGDKQYFYYGHQLAEKTGTELVFFFPNRLERTNFKSGFCGVDEGNKWFFKVSLAQKAKLAAYFGKEFLLNPAYLNRSITDTMHAFYSTYFLPNDRFLFMFDYLPWSEESLIKTLADHYDWEMAKDTKSTWRIGDGTAAFYNYIYYTIAGFTEHDTFRSNQIREGILTRQQGLEMAIRENQPRYDSIRQYAQTIGFDCDEAIRVINAQPKLYDVD